MITGRNLFYRILRLPLMPLAGISRLQDLLYRQLAPRRWPLSGRCIRCGRCCEFLAVGMPAWIWHRARLRALVRGYYEENYGFVHEGDREDGCLVFSCANLGPDRLCRIYPRRPRLCREYPSAWASEPPDLYPECGYRLAGPAGTTPNDGK
jgi:hypothetical protein